MTKKASEEEGPVDVDPTIALGLLTALEREERITQRTLAEELGIALGLANAYLKRAVLKGWIKVQQVPPNRYAYYLTPQGFHEKTRLTAEYLQGSFTFFRRAKDQISRELNRFAAAGHTRIVLVGVSELAEIASLCNTSEEFELIGIIDANSTKAEFAGLTVARRPEELPAADAFLITDLNTPQECYWSFARRYGQERVSAPEMLKVRGTLPDPVQHGKPERTKP